MPSILGRPHVLPTGQPKRYLRSSPSLPVLTNPVDNFNNAFLGEQSFGSSFIFQILSETDLRRHDNDSAGTPSLPSPIWSRSPSSDKAVDTNRKISSKANLTGVQEHYLYIPDARIHHKARRRSTMTNVLVEHSGFRQKRDAVMINITHSVSSPSLFVTDADQLKPLTPMPSISDIDVQPNWGFYVDAAAAAEDLDRRIDVYRQRRKR